MIVNFRVHEINRDKRKLTRTFILIKKINILYFIGQFVVVIF